jgi:hypothetical protein
MQLYPRPFVLEIIGHTEQAQNSETTSKMTAATNNISSERHVASL